MLDAGFPEGINDVTSQPEFRCMARVLRQILGCVLMAAPLLLAAQEPWKLKKDEDGVQLYTQNVPGSPYKRIKTVTTLPTTLTKVSAVLLDVMRTPDWVYGTKTCQLLKEESPSSLFYYAEMGMPWPASNRDFIIKISLSQHPVTRIITVLAENQPNYLPAKKGIVRIQQSSGRWQIIPLPNQMIRVEYVLEVDPGGVLPATLVNMFSYQGPFESFKNLKKQVTLPQYAGVNFPFVKD